MTIKKTILWKYTAAGVVETTHDGPAPRDYTSVRPRAVPAYPNLDDTQEIRGALTRAAEPSDGTHGTVPDKQECEGCGLPTSLDDDGWCNQCSEGQDRKSYSDTQDREDYSTQGDDNYARLNTLA